MLHTKSYHQGHPNPQRYRKDYVLLNGEWDFLFDEADIGMDQRYFEDFPRHALKINVPYAYQSESSGIHIPDDHVDTIWYHRVIQIEDLSKTYLLTFLAVDYETLLFVNGKKAYKHVGGYDAFSVDISPYLKLGENDIVLRVVDHTSVDQIRGKQTWRDRVFECFYTDTSGIVLPVYLEILNKQHIGYFSFKGDYKQKTLKIHLESDPCLEFSIVIYPRGEEKPLLEKTFSCKEADHEIVFDEIHGWSFKDPYLYDVKLVLLDNGKPVDEIETYFGFVSFFDKDGHIYVNDEDTYLKFVLDQGYFPGGITTPTEEQIITDLENILACGFNGLRKHEKIECPLFFYYADILGLYMWQECPSAHWYSLDSMKRYHEQLPRQIKDHFSHPCIMTYVIFNESWGIQDLYRYKEMREKVDELYDVVKAMAMDRFVVSNDGWEHCKSDLLTFHNYAAYEEDLDKEISSFDELKAGKNMKIATWGKTMFASEEYHYAGQPILFTEFAGIAFDYSNKGEDWGYGAKVTGEEGYLKRYASELHYIQKMKDIRGFCMTQLTDVEIEKNGLYTFERVPKVNIAKIKELHDLFK